MVITGVLDYFKVMKVLIFILVLALSAPPLQAGFCDMDMEKGQQNMHHMDKSSHGKHGCCDPEEADSPHGCDSGMNCGFCFVHATALPHVMKFVPAWERIYSVDISSGLVLPSHSSPPFRPPIA